MRSWALVGVVGRTWRSADEASESILVMAEAVGRAIAAPPGRNVVLTGGHHLHEESSVKYRALRGAIPLTPDAPPGRVMGIVPVDISRDLVPPIGDVSIKCESKSDVLRFLYVHTQLPGPQRDRITGGLADVLIALEGNKGTPREVAAAIIAGKPVVFLHSWPVLRPLVLGQLGNKAALLPTKPVEASEPMEAVEKALALCEGQRQPLRLTGLDASVVADFESCATRL